MYPFSIKYKIPITDVPTKELESLLSTQINGREISKVEKNMYELKEPSLSTIHDIFTLAHIIRIKEKELIISTSSPIATIAVVIFSIVFIGVFTSKAYSKGIWEFEYLIIIALVWTVLPAIFYLGYLFAIPTFRTLKKRINLLNQIDNTN